MTISFQGAARTATGSKQLVTLDSGKKILFDCGLFQRMGAHKDELNHTSSNKMHKASTQRV